MCEGVREKRETLGPRERREEEVGERDGEERVRWCSCMTYVSLKTLVVEKKHILRK